MANFREQNPNKRDSPKVVTKHTEYKHDLKDDFHRRCGYCNDADYWTGGWRFYQIDHFIPKKYLLTISTLEYSNLVYSCFFCNNSKRAKWPSKDEKIQFKGGEGFIHPKEQDYVNHLTRDDNGNILPTSDYGVYMIKAMKLNLKRHSLFWNCEKIDLLTEEIEKEYNNVAGNIPNGLKDRLIKLLFESKSVLKAVKYIGDE